MLATLVAVWQVGREPRLTSRSRPAAKRPTSSQQVSGAAARLRAFFSTGADVVAAVQSLFRLVPLFLGAMGCGIGRDTDVVKDQACVFYRTGVVHLSRAKREHVGLPDDATLRRPVEGRPG